MEEDEKRNYSNDAQVVNSSADAVEIETDDGSAFDGCNMIEELYNNCNYYNLIFSNNCYCVIMTLIAYNQADL